MNNFPAMTEAQRELEIASVKEMRSHVDFWGHASGFDAEFLMRCADAYLAMLTAKPVGYVSNVSREIANDGRLGYISNHIVAGLEGGYVYDAPPAPVLRLADGWIKCSERYPEVGQEILIRIPVCEKFNIENGKYEGEGRFLGAWFDTRGKGRPYKVTHWMPLPPPPEASNEQ